MAGKASPWLKPAIIVGIVLTLFTYFVNANATQDAEIKKKAAAGAVQQLTNENTRAHGGIVTMITDFKADIETKMDADRLALNAQLACQQKEMTQINNVVIRIEALMTEREKYRGTTGP